MKAPLRLPTIKRQTTATAVQHDHIIGGGLAAALGFLTTAYCVTREVWRGVRTRNGYCSTSQTPSNGGPLTQYITVIIISGGGGGLEATARCFAELCTRQQQTLEGHSCRAASRCDTAGGPGRDIDAADRVGHDDDDGYCCSF